MTASDPHNLQRFVDAQRSTFDTAFAEIRRGRKQGHWMWFVFPQLAGLGRSPTARHYGIASLDEARAYLEHPLLGPRLTQCVEALLRWAGKRSAEDILRPIDAIKLRSSLTLFEAASKEHLFGQTLDAFYSGERDDRTLEMLRAS